MPTCLPASLRPQSLTLSRSNTAPRGSLRSAGGPPREPRQADFTGRAWDSIDGLVAAIAAACPALEALEPAGDVRRVEALVSSVVLVARAPDPPAATATLASIRILDRVTMRSDRRLVGTVRNTPVEIRIAPPEDYGSTRFHATGSDAHVVHMTKSRAGRRSPRQAKTRSTPVSDSRTIPAELRQGTGEDRSLGRCLARLPALVETADIRGDLHMHTTYSDGRDTLESMLAGCHALGYEYIAITDHS